MITEPIDGPEQIGYRIRPEDFYLPDLHLEPDEQAALNIAVAEVHLGDPSGRDALWRLGIPSSVARSGRQPAIFTCTSGPLRSGAIAGDGDVRLPRGAPSVDPALLRFRQGRWYLAGFDRDPRSCADVSRRSDGRDPVDRSRPDRLDFPKEFDAEGALPDEPWKIGEEATRTVRVLVDALEGPRVVQQLGENSVTEKLRDGSVVVELEVSNEAALISWVLALGPHAEVLGPPEMRSAIVEWLRAFENESLGSRSLGSEHT